MRRLMEGPIRRASMVMMELFHPASIRGHQGQDLIEYALLAGFVAVAVAAVIPYAVTGPAASIFSKIAFYLKTIGNG